MFLTIIIIYIIIEKEEYRKLIRITGFIII